jgi:hypothetical protein
MSELIVIGYPDEKVAQDVWEELVKLATYDKFVEARCGLTAGQSCEPRCPARRSSSS